MEDNTPQAFSTRPVRLMLGILLICVIFLFDQSTKSFMIELLSPGYQPYPMTQFLNLRLGFNTGVSFGFLSGLGLWGPPVLSALTAVIIAVLLFLAWKSTNLYEFAAFSLIIGGALGNLSDRIRHGAVTDFLDFYISVYHWPTFNFADVAIAAGAAILIIRSFNPQLKSKN